MPNFIAAVITIALICAFDIAAISVGATFKDAWECVLMRALRLTWPSTLLPAAPWVLF